MRHSLWWLLGQFAFVIAAGAVFIAGVIALWYGVSFVVLTTVSRVFRLRGKAGTPADADPTGGPLWASTKGRWTMTLEEANQARARLSSRERDDRERICADRGHAWAHSGPNEAQQYCGRCFSTR